MLNAEQMRPAAAVFQDHSRSAPRPGATPSPVGGAGHRGGRDAMRHARLQRHVRLGRVAGADKPANGSAAGVRTDAMSFPANLSFATA